MKIETFADSLGRYQSMRKNRFLRPKLWTFFPRYPWKEIPRPKRNEGVPIIGGWSQHHLRKDYRKYGFIESLDAHWPGSKYALTIMGTFILYDQVEYCFIWLLYCHTTFLLVSEFNCCLCLFFYLFFVFFCSKQRQQFYRGGHTQKHGLPRHHTSI